MDLASGSPAPPLSTRGITNSADTNDAPTEASTPADLAEIAPDLAEIAPEFAEIALELAEIARVLAGMAPGFAVVATAAGSSDFRAPVEDRDGSTEPREASAWRCTTIGGRTDRASSEGPDPAPRAALSPSP